MMRREDQPVLADPNDLLVSTYQDKWAPLKDPGPFLITLPIAGIPRDSMSSCLVNHETRELVQAEAEGQPNPGWPAPQRCISRASACSRCRPARGLPGGPGLVATRRTP